MPDLRITLIQSEIIWEDIEANLQMFDEKINKISGKTEIVILPEMFTTGFTMNSKYLSEGINGRSINWMKRKSKQINAIITGSLIINENGKYYNRLIWAVPNGSIGYYDKRHLFSLGNENQHYSPGNKRLIASVKGWKICLNICYDLRFPVWSRNQNGTEYDILIYIANWPYKRIFAWNTLLIARAIENECYVIGVNRIGTDGNKIIYKGNSSLIDPLGKILYRKYKYEDIISFIISKNKLKTIRGKFPFIHDTDKFIIQ